MDGSKSSDDFLAHYGVMGMRWGKRKSSGGQVETSSKPKGQPSADAKEAAAAKKKISTGGTDALNNQELQAVVNRMNLEQQYSKLTSEPAKTNAGKKFAQDMAKDLAKQYVKQGIKAGVTYGVNKALKKPDDDD